MINKFWRVVKISMDLDINSILNHIRSYYTFLILKPIEISV